MKNVNKKIIAPILVVAVMIVASAYVLPVYARRGAGSEDMVTRLAEKLGVDESEVQEVFDEAKAERHAEMMQMLEEKLQKLVGEGKLSQELMDEWLDKVSEFHSEMDSFSSLTPDERREMMKEHRDEMKIWMDENGIDPSVLGFGMRMMNGKGHEGFGFGKELK